MQLKVRPKAYLFDTILFEKASCCFWLVGSLLDDRDNLINKASIILNFFFHHFFLYQTCVDPIFCFLTTKWYISLLLTQKGFAVKVLGSVEMMTEFSSFGKNFVERLIWKHENWLSVWWFSGTSLCFALLLEWAV